MKKHSAVACISQVGLFSKLSDSILKKIAPISTHQEHFPKGSIIRRPGDGKDGLIFMDEGSAKIYSLNAEGKETVLGVLNQGDFDGQLNLFQDNNNENFVQALQDTYVCFINRKDFQNLLKKTPDLALNLLNSFGQKLVAIETKSIRRNSMSAKERLLAYLEDLAKKQESRTVQLKLKKKDLASYLGVTPETLSRQLKSLEKDELISVEGKRIKIQ